MSHFKYEFSTICDALPIHTTANGYPIKMSISAGARRATFDGARLIWDREWDLPEVQRQVERAWFTVYEERCTETTERLSGEAAFGRVADLRALRARIDGEIARRASTGIVIEENGRDVHDCPPGGALFIVRWCTSDGSDRTWFPSVDGAKAALLAFADKDGRAPREDGMFVDLTPPGCRESEAWVEAH